MSTKIASQTVPMTMNLKRTFENAVRDIYQADLDGKTARSRTPIVQRAGTNPSEAKAIAEKRALSDAARALAQLWKITPTASR
jgi:hypothetical protein